MPNFKIDVDYGFDYANLTITKADTRKITPAWKTKSAPKLGPRQDPTTSKSISRPADRPKINAARAPNPSAAKKSVSGRDVPNATETSQRAAKPAAATNGVKNSAAAAAK